MPRQVDHDARKRRVAEAVCALASEQGIEGVTLRDVAARAQLSMGAVQRSFATRDAMLLFAVQYVGELVMSRVRERAGDRHDERAHARLSSMAFELAMLEAAQRVHAGVWLVFIAQAAVSPALAAHLRTSYAMLEKVCARLIRTLNPALDAVLEARALLALIDGLTLHVTVRKLPVRSAHAILNAQLMRLCPSARMARLAR